MQALGRHLCLAAAALVALTAAPSRASAQAPPAAAPAAPPAAPPPGAAPAPYPYPYPPPYGAYPPPAYYAPPPGAVPAAPAGPPSVISPWDPDQPPPEGYVLRSKVNGGLIGGGVAILTSFWVASLISGVVAAKDEEQAGIDGDGVEAGDWRALYIPVAGPFLTIDSVAAGPDGAAILVVDGVIQTFGLGMIVWGIVDQKYRIVRGTVAREAGTSIAIAPVVGGAVQGVSVQGSF